MRISDWSSDVCSSDLTHIRESAFEFRCFQCGLSRCTKDDAAAIVARQLTDRSDSRAEYMQRNGLGLIQYHDAVANVMQFTALRRFGGKQAFEKLDSGSDHDGRIPVLHRQPEFFLGLIAFWVALIRLRLRERAMVFEYGNIAMTT